MKASSLGKVLMPISELGCRASASCVCSLKSRGWWIDHLKRDPHDERRSDGCFRGPNAKMASETLRKLRRAGKSPDIGHLGEADFRGTRVLKESTHPVESFGYDDLSYRLPAKSQYTVQLPRTHADLIGDFVGVEGRIIEPGPDAASNATKNPKMIGRDRAPARQKILY